LTGEGGFKLDRHSDLFEETLGGICKNCMILSLRYDVTDVTGKKLLSKDEAYAHHMVLGSDVSGTPMSPLNINRMCTRGSRGSSGGLPLSPGSPGGSAPPSSPPSLGLPPRLPSLRELVDFFAKPPVIIINKGQEKNAINFMPLGPNQPESGFWIGSNDTIMTSVEIVNYKTTTHDVYLTLDIEYLSFDTRPKTYLKTEFAALQGISCAGIGMRKLFSKLIRL
jgi:hypothetical protein